MSPCRSADDAMNPADNLIDAAAPAPVRRRPRNLALALVDAFSQRIQGGVLAPGDKLPREATLMDEFDVSRTVVREALSMLQASKLVVTRHGIGTFVLGPSDESAGFRVTTDQMATLRDVISVLELRIAVESEAASLAATRRTDANLQRMRLALDAVRAAMDAGETAVEADFQFHLEVARAAQNSHFENLLLALGQQVIIPRARLNSGGPVPDSAEWTYLQRVQAEHESIFDAISAQDPEAARTTMRMHLVSSRERRRRLAASLAGAEGTQGG
jgi:GntR family transcriptional regulator, transcriptional repressor for pyruvate dehydrogenase complex